MKNRQIRLTIGILVGLVLFSSSLALLFYSKQDTPKIEKVKNIEVYAAKRYISKGTILTRADIKKIKIPDTYIDFTPLKQSEILGRYAAVDILDKEPLRKEKLSISNPQTEQLATNVKSQELEEALTSTQAYKKDTLTVSLTRFQNVDMSLKTGDYIDIVSIFPKKSGKGFDTKYVALKVKIDSFSNGSTSMNSMSMQVKEKTVLANSVVFEMTPTDIKNFFASYYETQTLNSNRVFNTKKISKGHLWMIKCSKDEDKQDQELKKHLLVDHVKRYRAVSGEQKVSISYEH